MEFKVTKSILSKFRFNFNPTRISKAVLTQHSINFLCFQLGYQLVIWISLKVFGTNIKVCLGIYPKVRIFQIYSTVGFCLKMFPWASPWRIYEKWINLELLIFIVFTWTSHLYTQYFSLGVTYNLTKTCCNPFVITIG